jgi:hypothetical protein
MAVVGWGDRPIRAFERVCVERRPFTNEPLETGTHLSKILGPRLMAPSQRAVPSLCHLNTAFSKELNALEYCGCSLGCVRGAFALTVRRQQP